MKSVVAPKSLDDSSFLYSLITESGLFDQVTSCIGKSALRNVCKKQIRFQGKKISVIVLDEHDDETLAMSPLRRFYATKGRKTRRFDGAFEAGREGWLDFEGYARRVFQALYDDMSQKKAQYSNTQIAIISTFYEDLPTLLSDESATTRQIRLDALVGILELIPQGK